MTKFNRLAGLVLVSACLGLGAGCDDSDGGGGGSSSGDFAGTWTGKVGGRGLTMVLNQNGTSLSGNYTLTDPPFGENLKGSASSATAPASAVLNGGADRRMEVTFKNPFSLSGGYFKGAEQVTTVSASK